MQPPMSKPISNEPLQGPTRGLMAATLLGDLSGLQRGLEEVDLLLPAATPLNERLASAAASAADWSTMKLLLTCGGTPAFLRILDVLTLHQTTPHRTALKRLLSERLLSPVAGTTTAAAAAVRSIGLRTLVLGNARMASAFAGSPEFETLCREDPSSTAFAAAICSWDQKKPVADFFTRARRAAVGVPDGHQERVQRFKGSGSRLMKLVASGDAKAALRLASRFREDWGDFTDGGGASAFPYTIVDLLLLQYYQTCFKADGRAVRSRNEHAALQRAFIACITELAANGRFHLDGGGGVGPKWINLIGDRWHLNKIRIEAEPHEAMVNFVAGRVMDVNAPGFDGYTGLYHALHGSATTHVRRLLELGADPRRRIYGGQSLFKVSTERRRYSFASCHLVMERLEAAEDPFLVLRSPERWPELAEREPDDQRPDPDAER